MVLARGILAALAVLWTAPPALAELAPARQMVLHEINVGQGASTLLEFPCGAVLIDAGGEGEADGPAADHLIAYLDAFFARRTDLDHRLAAVFVTHTHKDHNIGLRRVAERYTIGGYVHNGVLRGSGKTNARWMADHVKAPGAVIPSVGLTEAKVQATRHRGYTDRIVDPVACDTVDPKIRVLSGSYPVMPAGWSPAEFKKNGNLQSLVIRVDFGKAAFLFTGDLEDKAIGTLLANYRGTRALEADVYHVGHHGSYNGTTEAFVAAMTPRYALMGVGDGSAHIAYTAWDHGHPRLKAVKWLDAGIETARPAKSVRVFESVKFKHPELDDHAVWSMYDLKHAIYATGWDGDIDLVANDQGVISVRTEH